MSDKNVNIDEFLIAVNNLLSSKYILVDRKISDVLLSIADTAPVYNLIAECMVNFDFRYEWEMATKGDFIKFPETNAKKISFIFCLLNNIDDGNLDITKLLERFFSKDQSISPYDMFCRDVIVQFRDLVMQELGVEFVSTNDEQNDQLQAVPTNDYEVLTSLLKDFAAMVNADKKLKKCFMSKQDIVAVISTFEQAVSEGKIGYYYAFMVTLKANFEKNKLYKSKLDRILELANNLILRG